MSDRTPVESLTNARIKIVSSVKRYAPIIGAVAAAALQGLLTELEAAVREDERDALRQPVTPQAPAPLVHNVAPLPQIEVDLNPVSEASGLSAELPSDPPVTLTPSSPDQEPLPPTTPSAPEQPVDVAPPAPVASTPKSKGNKSK